MGNEDIEIREASRFIVEAAVKVNVEDIVPVVGDYGDDATSRAQTSEP